MSKDKLIRYDPIHFFDQGGSSYGQVEQVNDGDFVKHEDYEKLETELNEAKELLSQVIEDGTRTRCFNALTREDIKEFLNDE